MAQHLERSGGPQPRRTPTVTTVKDFVGIAVCLAAVPVVATADGPDKWVVLLVAMVLTYLAPEHRIRTVARAIRDVMPGVKKEPPPAG